MKQPDIRSSQFITRLPTAGETMRFSYHSKTAANVKAELIRRNLLSRKDLM